MPENPLGISTGQGKGLAQVFGDTYSDHFKQKADEGAKKKAEIEAALAKSSAGVWDRDLGMFKPMREELRKYVQDNARDIIKGDFDATVGWQAKQNEMMDFVNSSKAAKAFYDSNMALLNKHPNDYSDLSRKDLMEYANTAGRFDSNVFLEGNFDAKKSLDDMNADLAKVQYVSGGVKEKTLPSGDVVLVDESAQRKEVAQQILESRIARDLQEYPRQATAYWTDENKAAQLKRLEDSLGQKTKFSQKMKDRKPWGQQKIEDAANRRKIFMANVKTDPAEAKKELGNILNRKNRNTGDVVVEATVLEPGDEGVPNRTVKITYEGQDPMYFDTTDPAYETKFNAEISSINGMENLDDNDLSLVPNVKTPKVESKGDLKELSLENILIGDDLDDRLKDLMGAKQDLLKSIKDPNLKDKISKGFFSDTDKISSFITDEVSGNNFRGGKVKSVVYNSESLGSDLYEVTIIKDGKEEVVEIESANADDVKELLGSKKLTAAEIAKAAIGK